MVVFQSTLLWVERVPSTVVCVMEFQSTVVWELMFQATVVLWAVIQQIVYLLFTCININYQVQLLSPNNAVVFERQSNTV